MSDPISFARGRSTARDLVEMFTGDCVDADEEPGFWSMLRELCDEHSPQPKPRNVNTIGAPMSDREQKVFELQTMEFGKHRGRSVGWLAENDLGYLEWLANDGAEFYFELRRYLAAVDLQPEA